ncbi:MAG: FAD-linked oxidase C-terminal domain-containing protein [Pirellulales bacterium]
MQRLERVLRQCVTRGRVLTAPAQLAGYDADGIGYKTFRPDAVVIPGSTEELANVLQHAKLLDVPICMRGAGTSLSGGPVAAQGGVIVHTSALRSVRQIHSSAFWCEVECGVTLNQLDEALKPYGVFYPPDPSSGPVCTLGGNVAMNAGGAHCFRYGVTSNYVLGVEAVLLDGTVQRFGGPAGGRGSWREDWKRLMVGSEGTLGAFTRFWLRTLPRPEKVWTFRATYADLVTAERAIHRLAAHSSFPVAIELMDPRCVAMVENSHMAVGLPKDSFMLLTEIDGPRELVDARVESVAQILRDAGSKDVVYSDEEEPRKKLWKARKVAGGLMGQLSADFVVQDAVIPKRALAELLQLVYDEADAAGVAAVNVFHAGDGNLHPNFMFDARKPGELERVEHIGKRLMQRVVEVGGTLSGEHGIGNDKAAYMPLVFGPEMTRIQLAVPNIFNPAHQMNPLKVFNQRRYEGGSTNGAPAPTKSTPLAGAATDARLFTPFLDEIDGVACVPAAAKAADLRSAIGDHPLRYPLLLDADASLREHVLATGYASASSRFGPYCDNILGMNWRLPSGRVVRFGERVVKTTTGYDLFRFVLGGGSRWGEPLDYVVRLRPNCGPTNVYRLRGSLESVERAAGALLKNCWMHWFDSLDVLQAARESTRPELRLVINGPANEANVADGYVKSLAAAHRLTCDAELDRPAPLDGLPDLMLKTTPDRAIAIGAEVARDHAVRTTTLCYPGVVHVYCELGEASAERLRPIVARYATRLHESGGDWHSRHLPPNVPAEREARWISILEQETHDS